MEIQQDKRYSLVQTVFEAGLCHNWNSLVVSMLHCNVCVKDTIQKHVWQWLNVKCFIAYWLRKTLSKTGYIENFLKRDTILLLSALAKHSITGVPDGLYRTEILFFSEVWITVYPSPNWDYSFRQSWDNSLPFPNTHIITSNHWKTGVNGVWMWIFE